MHHAADTNPAPCPGHLVLSGNGQHGAPRNDIRAAGTSGIDLPRPESPYPDARATPRGRPWSCIPRPAMSPWSHPPRPAAWPASTGRTALDSGRPTPARSGCRPQLGAAPPPSQSSEWRVVSVRRPGCRSPAPRPLLRRLHLGTTLPAARAVASPALRPHPRVQTRIRQARRPQERSP
jgi:hypothetical protein